MKSRSREEPRSQNGNGGTGASALRGVAVGWLQDILRSEFPPEPAFALAAREQRAANGFCRAEWLRLAGRLRVLGRTDSRTGFAGRDQLALVIQHAWVAVEQGDTLTLVAIAVGSENECECELERALGAVAEALRLETGSCGIALHFGTLDLLLVLPQMELADARFLVERSRDRVGSRGRFRAGIAQHAPGINSFEQLAAIAAQALAADRG